MKLTAAQQTRFVQHPNPSVRVILIYGPDSGLVSEHAESLAKILVPNKDDPFSVSRMTGAEVKEHKSKLYDEASALSFGGGRRLIRLQQAIDGNSVALTSFLEEPPDCDSVILIEAGALEARSKLRKLCEGKTDLAVAIACYVEDATARSRTVSQFLKDHKLNASREVVQFLCDVLPPNRQAMRQELDKLVLYMQGHNSLTLEDIKNCVSNAGGADIDSLIQATACGNVKQVVQLIDFLFSEQTSPIALVRAMQRHFMRLQLAQFHMENGMNADGALKKLRPPVFWKNQGPMKQQLGRWPLARLELRLIQLSDVEAALKRTGTPDKALCSQLFLHMAAKG